MRVLVASNNPKKLAELRRLLDAAQVAGIELCALRDVPAYPEPRETGRTFADNALIKAEAGAQASGLVTVADDSGLAVDELGGMPGVLSARWCGRHGDDEANNALLLGQLGDVPDERRAAAFVSVCTVVAPDGRRWSSEGRWEGEVLRAPRGENGFGYDPLFLPAEERAGEGRSAAQLSPENKDALSHRAKALAGLVPVLAELAATEGAGGR